jgi:predicted O-methyltransferase YrrM
MKSTQTTWNDYFDPIKTRLGARQLTFEKIFQYLDTSKEPLIVETGTYREENNYTGDGCSTLLFDNYIDIRGTGKLISIDNDPAACALARENTKHAKVIEGDSVETLDTLFGPIDLLYLDSYNITDWNNDWAPASHHLKELFAGYNLLGPGTLIVVDDNIKAADSRRHGKGRLVHELMEALGVDPYFDSYQVGWIWC